MNNLSALKVTVQKDDWGINPKWILYGALILGALVLLSSDDEKRGKKNAS